MHVPGQHLGLLATYISQQCLSTRGWSHGLRPIEMPLCAFTVSAYTLHLRQIMIPHTGIASTGIPDTVIEPPLWLPDFTTHPHATRVVETDTSPPPHTSHAKAVVAH